MSRIVCDWAGVEFPEQAYSSRSEAHAVQVKAELIRNQMVLSPFQSMALFFLKALLLNDNQNNYYTLFPFPCLQVEAGSGSFGFGFCNCC